MLNLAAAKIWLCVEPTDMRKSFDTLAPLAREHLQGDPLSGSWFVFRGKRGDRLKILYWDGDGYAIWQKRLAKGAFEFPKVIGRAAGVAITATDLALILGGGRSMRSGGCVTRDRRRRMHNYWRASRIAQLFAGLVRRRSDAGRTRHP